MEGNCLNCNSPLHGKYCSECGQIANTKRIVMKELLTTHFVDGIFSFNKGTFFTMKEVVFRPGMAPRDFIAGKRKPYFNVFFLLLLILGLNILVGEIYFDEPWISFSKSTNSVHTNNQWDFNQLYKDNRKLIFFFLVPLLGFYG